MTLKWVPKSTLNPNPNLTPITQPSSSNPPKFNPNYNNYKPKTNRNRNRYRNRNRKPNYQYKIKPKFPNWVELPEDVWFLILSKLYTIDIIENVQKVCTLFRKICIQPSMFRVINMYLPDAYMDLPYNVNKMTKYAVDRSAGQLLDIYLEYLCDDDTLAYIVDRSKNLKHLRIGHYIYISEEGLIDAVKKLPVLKELEIIICSFSEETYEAIGHACPSLKSFSLNSVGSRQRDYCGNEEALAIAKSMPKLHRLQLIGNCMTNEGLKAILDGCPLLESLDLRACFNIKLSGDLAKRCGKIKHVLYPDDSTSDYRHQAYTDNEYFPDDFFEGPGSDFDADDFLSIIADFDMYPDFDDYDDFPPYDFAAVPGDPFWDDDFSD